MKAEEIFNKILNEHFRIRGSTRQKTHHFYYNPPKGWEGTIYRFGYTPWKIKDPETGKVGYWALKYRYLKSKKQWKLVKKVRFGRRKIAYQRSLKWYNDYYGKSD